MFDVDLKRIRTLERRLEQLNEKGAPFARRDTLNGLAFGTQREAREFVGREFVERNKWTRGSIRVDRARSTRDSSEVGSTEEYMADQEFGARGGPINVPTPVASGEAPRAKVRRRPVRRPNRMNAINLGKRTRNASRAQQNIVAVKEAAEAGRKFVFLDRGRRKGIYRIKGGKRRPRVRMVQDLTRRQRVVPRHPWLTPSTQVVAQQVGRMYSRQLRRQLQRLR